MTLQGKITSEYKQTDVGVIPKDWEVSSLGDVVQFLDSLRRPVKSGDRAKMYGVYPYYGASGIIDYVNDYIFDEDLILLGEDGENILSRSLPLAFRVSGKIWVNNHAHVIRPMLKMDIGYLTEYLESLDYSDFNTGTAQPKLNKKSCARIPVIVPPLPEQRAIAEALGDVDARIAALEVVIAKKRDLKQAAMQQLLTGKTRLPGFSGAWKMKRLGECANFFKGKGLPKAAISASGEIPCIHYGELFTIYGIKITEVISYTSSRNNIFSSLRNDVLMPTSDVTPRGLAKASCLLLDDVIVGGDVLVIRPDAMQLHGPFLALQIRFQDDQVLQLVTGSTVFHLYAADMRKFELPVPKITEQIAIAEVLSDMDADLEALEAEAAKARTIKQGMMQCLLTGQVRLI